MPLVAYFWKVGAALLALLLVVDFCLPRTPSPEGAALDRPNIRIHSDRKWPERVVLDTRSPVSVAAAPVVAMTEEAGSSATNEPSVTRTNNPAVANAYALLPRPDSRPPETADRKRQRKPSHVASRPREQARRQMLLAARQRQFAWFGFRYW